MSVAVRTIPTGHGTRIYDAEPVLGPAGSRTRGRLVRDDTSGIEAPIPRSPDFIADAAVGKIKIFRTMDAA